MKTLRRIIGIGLLASPAVVAAIMLTMALGIKEALFAFGMMTVAFVAVLAGIFILKES